MEPIRLRAHHIGNLRDHKFSPRLTQAMDVLYGIEHTRRTAKIYDRILEGKTPVVVVDDYDDTCDGCQNRVEDGCVVAGKFYPAQETSKSDRLHADHFKVELGRTYEGLDFLRRVL